MQIRNPFSILAAATLVVTGINLVDAQSDSAQAAVIGEQENSCNPSTFWVNDSKGNLYKNGEIARTTMSEPLKTLPSSGAGATWYGDIAVDSDDNTIYGTISKTHEIVITDSTTGSIKSVSLAGVIKAAGVDATIINSLSFIPAIPGIEGDALLLGFGMPSRAIIAVSKADVLAHAVEPGKTLSPDIAQKPIKTVMVVSDYAKSIEDDLKDIGSPKPTSAAGDFVGTKDGGFYFLARFTQSGKAQTRLIYFEKPNDDGSASTAHLMGLIQFESSNGASVSHTVEGYGLTYAQGKLLIAGSDGKSYAIEDAPNVDMPANTIIHAKQEGQYSNPLYGAGSGTEAKSNCLPSPARIHTKINYTFGGSPIEVDGVPYVQDFPGPKGREVIYKLPECKDPEGCQWKVKDGSDKLPGGANGQDDNEVELIKVVTTTVVLVRDGRIIGDPIKVTTELDGPTPTNAEYTMPQCTEPPTTDMADGVTHASKGTGCNYVPVSERSNSDGQYTVPADGKTHRIEVAREFHDTVVFKEWKNAPGASGEQPETEDIPNADGKDKIVTITNEGETIYYDDDKSALPKPDGVQWVEVDENGNSIRNGGQIKADGTVHTVYLRRSAPWTPLKPAPTRVTFTYNGKPLTADGTVATEKDPAKVQVKETTKDGRIEYELPSCTDPVGCKWVVKDGSSEQPTDGKNHQVELIKVVSDTIEFVDADNDNSAIGEPIRNEAPEGSEINYQLPECTDPAGCHYVKVDGDNSALNEPNNVTANGTTHTIRLSKRVTDTITYMFGDTPVQAQLPPTNGSSLKPGTELVTPVLPSCGEGCRYELVNPGEQLVADGTEHFVSLKKVYTTTIVLRGNGEKLIDPIIVETEETGEQSEPNPTKFNVPECTESDVEGKPVSCKWIPSDPKVTPSEDGSYQIPTDGGFHEINLVKSMQDKIIFVDTKNQPIGLPIDKADTRKGESIEFDLPQCTDPEGCSYVVSDESSEGKGNSVTANGTTHTVVLKKRIPATPIVSDTVIKTTKVVYTFKGEPVGDPQVKQSPDGERMDYVLPQCSDPEGCEWVVADGSDHVVTDGDTHTVVLKKRVKALELTPAIVNSTNSPASTTHKQTHESGNIPVHQGGYRALARTGSESSGLIAMSLMTALSGAALIGLRRRKEQH